MKINKRTALVAIALLLVGAVGAYFARPAIARYTWPWRSELRELPVQGTTISYRDFGKGTPVAVIIQGVAVPKDAYYKLQRDLSRVTRVLSYDRPGLGESADKHEPRTLDYIDKDLKAFLQALKVPPPYILIGHSMGGHIIRYYADRHPGEVAGLVYLDAPHEDWPRYIRATWPAEVSEEYFKRLWSKENAKVTGVLLEETLAYETNCDMIRGVRSPPDVPALMFTGNNWPHFRKDAPGVEEDRRNWVAMQASMIEGVKDKKQIIDWDVGHWMFNDKPESVTSEISAFIIKVRQGLESPSGKASP
jgi:pimeloyl-ACP methyl ester carboxylesterase